MALFRQGHFFCHPPTSGLMIRAFRYLAKKGVRPDHLAALRRTLSPEDRRRLGKDRIRAPAWMHRHFVEIPGMKQG